MGKRKQTFNVKEDFSNENNVDTESEPSRNRTRLQTDNLTRQEIHTRTVALRRSNETESEKLQRQTRDADSHAIARVAEDPEQTANRHRHDAEAHARTRVAEDAVQTANRQRQDAEAHAKARAAEDAVQTANRQRQDAEAHTVARAAEDAVQTANRQRQDAEAHARVILNDTSEQSRSRMMRHNNAERISSTRRHQQRVSGSLCKAVMENINENEIPESYLGKMNVICTSCQAKHFKSEKPSDGQFNVCCNKGKVRITALPSHDDYIKRLMTGEDPDSNTFMENIRSYNSAFAYVSVGADVKLPPGFGPYCFRIHGQIYHRAGTLHPHSEDVPKYAQLYIFDPDEADSYRLNDVANQQCKKHIMEKLNEVMKANKFTEAYKMLHEVEKEESAKAEIEDRPKHKITMAILQDRSSDPRRYNVQKCNEVAVVFSNSDGEPPFERDLLIHLRAEDDNGLKMKRVSVLNKNLDALTYPLLYPKGEQGWGEDLQLYNSKSTAKNPRKRITLKMYYSSLFSVRDGFNPFLQGGKLSQQYIVDSYVKAESNDLNYIRHHQKELRAEKYSDLVEHLANENADVPGKRIILPSTFQGSPRNMQQNYQDAMAIVQKYGKPDLFITMTCNPRWTEIVESLNPSDRIENRPDIVSRVFKLKLQELLHDIKKNSVFGEILAIVHVIEFQKRGLPHAHMLIFLKQEFKPLTVSVIDKMVSAEMPNKLTHPRLFEIVTKNMIHGPCDKASSKSPCLSNGKCTKSFPKRFQAETNPNCNGYPLYKRRQFAPERIGDNDIDNRWIVPYNPYLSLKYNCHINVEVCASVKSVKYLFKYAYKGHDCANVVLNIDEIKTHVDSRYVCPPEAIWRIFRFPMHEQSHSVTRLAVHLYEEQLIAFDPQNINERQAEWKGNKDTTLTAWFKLNEADPSAREYRYTEIPEHYVFNQVNNKWIPRKRGHEKIIGRMHFVNIKDSERYFLRLLLLHTKGARSFTELLTHQNIHYHNFFDAAKARGLVTDETIWNETLRDACCVSMPKQLRDMFAYICAFAKIRNALPLWMEYREFLVEDYSRIHNHDSTEDCENCDNYALRDIQETLRSHGLTCENCNLNTPPDNLPNSSRDFFNAEIEREKSEDLMCLLNDKQREAFNEVVNSIQDNRQMARCYFLDGPGGSGKTFVYTTLLSHIRGNNRIVLPVASTGVAANLLKGGRTYHSQYKLPLNLNETSVSSMTMNNTEARTIREAKLLIWDESTMAPAHALNCVDRLLKDIMQNEMPFGAKTMLLGGDFRQCLPVVPHAEASAVVQSSIKFSPLWRQFTTLKLDSNVRSVDIAYSDWLIKLGNGELKNDCGLQDSLIEIPETMLTNNIVKEIFGDNLTKENVNEFTNKAILCPRNEDVDEINAHVLHLLEGNSQTYYSSDSLDKEDINDAEDYPIEFLNSLSPSGIAPHRLNLKVGAIVMLLRNFNTKRGLCNGTRLVIEEMKSNVLIAKVITGSAKDEVVMLPRIDLITQSDLPFQLKRRQFPVKLAFAMTINKSQGQTLDKVGIHLPNPVFSHGQLYVAFSRVRRAADVKVTVIDTAEQGKLLEDSEKVFTKNVVYKVLK